MIYSSQVAQPEITLITRHNIVDKVRSDFDQEHLRFFSLILQTVQLYEQDSSIDQYLPEASITPQQVQRDLQEIISCHEVLKRQYYGKPIMMATASRTLKFMNDWIEDHDVSQMNSKQKAIWILKVIVRIGHSYRYFFLCGKEEKRITNTPKRDYEEVWKKITVKKLRDPQGLKQRLAEHKEKTEKVLASVLCGQKWEVKSMKEISVGASLVQYSLMGDSVKLKTLGFYLNPKLQDAQALLNCTEDGLLMYMNRFNFEDIKMKKKIWLPADGEMHEGLDVHSQQGDKIMVRILSHQELYFQGEKSTSSPQVQTIIIYIHGGAFMGSSSRSAQGMTRKWANQLKIPVFCIDYRMPPEHTYPGPVYDCYHAYNFIVNHIHKFMNVRPKNIYMVGDSAGACLCCSTTALLLKNTISPPKGLYLPYPVLEARRDYTDSGKYMTEDLMLGPSMIRLSVSSYLDKQFFKGNQPLASPVLLTQQFIFGTQGDTRFPVNWPKTILTTGTNDPLSDGSLLMMEKMVPSGIDCELIMYQGLGHCLIGLGKVLEKGEKPSMQSVKHLRKLMGLTVE